MEELLYRFPVLFRTALETLKLKCFVPWLLIKPSSIHKIALNVPDELQDLMFLILHPSTILSTL